MIVTSRARWIIGLAFVSAVLGVLRQQPLVVWFALACLFWVGCEWLVFRCQVEFGPRSITTRRRVRDLHGRARVLWEGRSFEVTVEVSCPWRRILPPLLLDIRDLLPPAADLKEGENGVAWSTGSPAPALFRYQLVPGSVGAIRFVGLRVLCQDLHGFFQVERFLDLPETFRVLPWVTNAGSITSTKKPHNALSPPGVHRVAKAGAGSELLEIRDYLPGDSPRSIAWKVSAKRGSLMCKQFESEVPVRCHLLVDMSFAVRLGYPGPCSGSKLVSLAATIADTLVANRDPVGCSIVAGETVTMEKPSASRQAVLRIVDRLAAAIDKPPEPRDVAAQTLLPAAMDVARIRRPQLFDEARRGTRGFLPRTRLRRRKLHMALFLASYYALSSVDTAELAEVDHVLSRWLQHFLAEHHAPYVGSLFQRGGGYVFHDAAKVATFAKLIQRAVLHGQDNELFIVMAELCDHQYDLTPLVKAIKVARARHHRVMFLCAWPPREPFPGPELTTRAEQSPVASAETLARQHRLRALQRLRQEVCQLRVPVAVAADEVAERIVLHQLALIRAGRVVL